MTYQLQTLIQSGLNALHKPNERADIENLVSVLAPAADARWFAERSREDNRREHEFVVFAAAMRIAEAENLPLTSKRAVAGFVFTHDSYPIARKTERMIREATPDLAKQLDQKKTQDRKDHMAGGAKNADALFRELGILTDDERDRVVRIIERHDCWKLRDPHPLWADREAVVCLEADALYPLHPYGVLADLEREGRDVYDPSEWRKQVRNNLQTLEEYRANWQGMNEPFQDGRSIFRTREGYRLYTEWRGLLGVY
jgi:hypothetical protein